MKLRHEILFFLILLTIIAPELSKAQKIKKIEILHANTLVGTEQNGEKVRKLIGNVALSHEGVIMYCDSAYEFLSQNYFDAYGNIRIVQGDSINVTARFLRYDIKNKIATLQQQVNFRHGVMRLTTPEATYDLTNGIAFYLKGADIIDTTNQLSSRKGYYYTSTKDVFFREKVKLVNPDFTLECDTLKYNANQRIATFLSPTVIEGKDNKIYTNGGWYNTELRISEFREKPLIISKNQTLKGDILYYENKSGYSRASGNVILYDSSEKVEISGHYAERSGVGKSSFITGKALFRKFLNDDTLNLHADTIMTIPDSTEDKNIIIAYRRVRVYSTEMQLICDSMSYRSLDSTIRLYYQPVMWNGKNQVNARFITIFMKNNEIDRMALKEEAFLAEMVDSQRFNQVKGRDMTGYFKDGKLVHIFVEGNAESVYYLLDDYGKFIGRNNIESGYIRINMENGKVSKISFLSDPVGKVTPPEQMDGAGARLKEFTWKGNARPQSIEDLFRD